MAWTKQQIFYHKKAARLLDRIMIDVFVLLKKTPGISEREIQNFILKQYKKHDLKTAPKTPIAAFRENTSFVHYYPSAKKSKRLKPGSLILIDIWAGLNKLKAPFADMTWMGFRGKKMPAAQAKLFKTVLRARDKCLSFVKLEVKKGRLPIGKIVDSLARKYIERRGYKNKFPHGLGHALGLNHPHGKEAPLSPRGHEPLQKNLGYTIEPGIYLPGKFGARSEINFYVNKNNQVVVTTKIQKKIVFI